MKSHNLNLSIMITTCVDLLEQCGINVVGITTDQGTNFAKFFRNQNCTPDRPSITVEGKKIHVIAT